MKRQFYFAPEERDLLRTALRYIVHAIEEGPYYGPDGTRRASFFTKRRCDDLLTRLQEPDNANVVSVVDAAVGAVNASRQPKKGPSYELGPSSGSGR